MMSVCNGKYCKDIIRKNRNNTIVCTHNNLTETHPELVKEWSSLNKLGPENYTYGSGVKAIWECPKNECGCHVFTSQIRSRANNKKGTGCPFCNIGQPCKHNNLMITHPVLCEEWSNLNELGPENYTYGSHSKVFWNCPNNICGCHVYESTIAHRVENKGCPFCNKGLVCPHNNLTKTHPELCKEWDYERNELGPENYTYRCDNKVYWVCPNNICGCHIYKSSINNRAKENGTGCHFCNSNTPCKHNNLSIIFPELCKEWDSERNELGPENYSYGSGVKVYWICPKQSHSYCSSISNRTKKSPTGCPNCAPISYSKSSIEWLNNIMLIENVNIKHAENGGEFPLPGIGKVDGFCVETNTVYEFHGDFWHGNPARFHPDDYNQIVNKTYGELYNKTLKRDKLIISYGYNLIVMWEHDYSKSKSNMTNNGIFKNNNSKIMKLKII